LIGTENGLGEIGVGEWAEPNIALAVGTGSGVVGDGGTFGLEFGEGHTVADESEEPELINRPSRPGSVDSSYGLTTVGSNGGGGWKSCSYS